MEFVNKIFNRSITIVSLSLFLTFQNTKFPVNKTSSQSIKLRKKLSKQLSHETTKTKARR
tara:strand:+ start:29905 stop:30084 length:180 start_codon:yes stop_codon:yes gene_type:complete